LRGFFRTPTFRQQPQLVAAQGADAGPLLDHAVTAHRRKKPPDQGETVRAATNYRIRANEWSKGYEQWKPLCGRKARHPAVTDAVARLYFLAISFTGAFLFVAVEKIEPNRRFALVLKFAILAAGGAAIASQLLP
jgi:hypothetical protein